MARPSPASHDAGLDECEQAGLLASRSFYSAGLTDAEHQWLIGISSLVTAALPRGIWSEDRTRFPILLKPWFEALAHVYHYYWWLIQRTSLLVWSSESSVNCFPIANASQRSWLQHGQDLPDPRVQSRCAHDRIAPALLILPDGGWMA